MAPASRLDVAVLTGFLGSGKTTLLRHALATPMMRNSAVLINEIGEIGLDHRLIDYIDEDVVLLGSGCLCCSVRADLAGALRRLALVRMRERSEPFDRVVIETSGLADPAPILATLSANPFLRDRFSLRCVVATVDAVFGERQLEDHGEAVRQVACADRLLVTKTDLADAAGRVRLGRVLRQLAPGRMMVEAIQGAVDPAVAFAPAEIVRDIDGVATIRQGGTAESHLSGIGTSHLSWDKRLRWSDIARCVERLLQQHGERVLRVKAVLHLLEQDDPVVLQGVQHVLYPPRSLPRRVATAGRSQLVVIAQALPSSEVVAYFRDL